MQEFLLRLYEWVAERGLLRTATGRKLFHATYVIYKTLLEAPGVGHLQELVPAGTTVVDVGANIGYFTVWFADWVGPDGCVLAIEPDTENLAALRHRVQRGDIQQRVRIIAAVADRSSGSARLKLNPNHPGDHMISESGIEVAAVTIDSLLGAEKYSPLSLIKIDVQGAEMRVLSGAAATLAKFRPALVIEVGDAQLRSYGSSAAELIDHLSGLGYRPFSLTRRGIGKKPEEREKLLVQVAQRYADVVFLSDRVI